jgi:hypothetical protein
MWGNAHLVDLSGACFVTTALQKGQSEANRHNVAPGFSKAGWRCASVGCGHPTGDAR